MAALPADIIRATRAARVVTWTGPTTEGRDGLRSIEPGYFEDPADAAAVLESKAELIGVQRRRFRIDAQGEIQVEPSVSIPSFRLIDDELGVDLPAILTRFEYDMETETSSLEVIG